ncbi:MAG: PIG-L family deacetylase, partial [Acidobacteriota bacterium]
MKKMLGEKVVRSYLYALTVVLLCLPFTLPESAQVRPVYDQGALGLAQALKRVNTSASVLMTGAHPDDEDSALLTYLARGENARTAYLSLTRGDGGQNLIGPELGEALGVIRTEELLQARRLDGAEQFFTSAYDFGFSKTLAEARERWDEKVILCDVVRVIRSYQPLVVISQFSGTPADGHGQHQYSGYISPIAVKAAGDPAQCTQSGAPWTVKKFYVRHRGAGKPTLRINTGRYDPLLGRSYFEIAMQARSQHRSQEQGVLELKGDQFSNLDLVSGPRVEKEKGIFDGLDILVTGQPGVGDYDPQHPELLIPKLLAGLPNSQIALLRAAGVQIDILADRETVVAGENFRVSVRLFAPAAVDVKVVAVDFNFPHKEVQPAPSSAAARQTSANFAEDFELVVPPDAAPSQPYWLLAPRQGDLFSSPAGRSPSQPFSGPVSFADIILEIGGKRITVRRPVEYRFADDIRGEIRRELNVVPKIAVGLDRELIVISTRDKQPAREVSVNLTNNTRNAVTGKVTLNLPAGWRSTPAERDFSMNR